MPLFCSNCGNSNADMAKFCSGCGNSLTGGSSNKGILSMGTKLDRRYEIISLIKSGGMGSVYKAKDTRLKRVCAVKEMLGQYKTPEEEQYAIKRFEEEAYILANLVHGNLPAVIDYFIENGRYYLVMDFIAGTDLGEMLKIDGDPGIGEKKLVGYAIQILDVLDYLHNQNPPIVYRDIKPSNIMIRSSDDKAILIDFGIARAVRTDSDDKKTAIGTPGYIAPEQWTGKPVPISDLFSMGATMHHLLTGREPNSLNFEPLTNFVEYLSPDLNTIVMKALEKKSDKRYETAKEMKRDLENYGKKPLFSRQQGKGKCNKCKKVFPVSDLIVKEDEVFCIDCLRTGPITISAKRADETRLMPDPVKSIIHPKDNSEMILIPKGTFTMGSNGGSDEKPLHEVYLDEYYIDKYPVTNEQFKIFIDATGYVSEGTWLKYTAPMKRNYPVVGISWNDARAYAGWAGKSLPTEAEWEKAARGTDNREFPWGNTWDPNKSNNRKMKIKELIDDMIIILAGRGTVPVGSFPEGASFYSVMDMAGNASQWCMDWYSPGYYSVSPDRNPTGAPSGSWKVIRGGSWWDGDINSFRCCTRNGDHPESSKAHIGFRCVYKENKG